MTVETLSKTPQEQESAAQQIKMLQKEVKYDLRDFVVEYIVDKFRDGFFYVPDYQREFIWRDVNRHRFIESVILGLPIPMMFVAEIEDDGCLEIVDGAQRIQTLEAFMNNDMVLKNLKRLTDLNGFRFCDLPTSHQNKFKTKAMRIVVLEDSTTEETRKEIFRRINTSGEKAKPSEVRRGAFAGPFWNFIEKSASDEKFRLLCPITEAMCLRREPQELTLRFFAYSDRYKSFKHDVDSFLDKYVIDHRTSFDKELMSREFSQMLNFVERHFPYGFAKTPKSRTTPRVRFEAISVGVNLALRKKPDLKPAKVTEWLSSPEFAIHTTSHATNSRPRLAGRVEYVRDQLLSEAQ